MMLLDRTPLDSWTLRGRRKEHFPCAKVIFGNEHGGTGVGRLGVKDEPNPGAVLGGLLVREG